MRLSMSTGLATCLLVVVTAAAGAAQEGVTGEEVEFQRIEVPEAGISMAFPAGWSVATRMVREEGQLPPGSGEEATTDVMLVLEAADQTGGGCLLGMYPEHPLPFDEHVEWVARQHAETPDVVASVGSSPVELPFGQAMRIDIVLTDGGHSAAYLFESGESRYQLFCGGPERPPDDWRSVAETIEFVPLVPMDLPAQGAAGLGEGVDIVWDFPTTVSVVAPGTDDVPLASLMNAGCAFALWVEAEDGSATEWIACTLDDSPVQPAEYQGVPPTETVTDSGGECIWRSDYWYQLDRSEVIASRFESTVTPSGQVFAMSTYPAVPLDCSDG